MNKAVLFILLYLAALAMMYVAFGSVSLALFFASFVVLAGSIIWGIKLKLAK